jgi:hypothetical protein
VTSPSPPFVAGGPCPAAVAGNEVAVTIGGEMYLLDAVEIVDPSSPGYAAAGNHDGLCESGESCIYTPNFGVYQGEGTLGTCTFEDGPVTGVTMYGYSTNGV